MSRSGRRFAPSAEEVSEIVGLTAATLPTSRMTAFQLSVMNRSPDVSMARPVGQNICASRAAATVARIAPRATGDRGHLAGRSDDLLDVAVAAVGDEEVARRVQLQVGRPHMSLATVLIMPVARSTFRTPPLLSSLTYRTVQAVFHRHADRIQVGAGGRSAVAAVAGRIEGLYAGHRDDVRSAVDEARHFVDDVVGDEQVAGGIHHPAQSANPTRHAFGVQLTE